MQRRSLFLVLVVLVFVPRVTVGVQRCYSTSCSSSYHVCIRLCQTNEHCCHIRFSPDRINRLLAADLGCGNMSQSLNSTSVVPEIHYSCEGDLCNYVDYLTYGIQPLFDIPLNLPKDPPPHPLKGYQLCERYHCSSGDCRADYEFCLVTLPTMGYCQAVYIVSATTMKVELHSKGCQIVSGNLLDITSECHIDNHLDSPAGAILECTCNGNLCNQEITFTNPTRHAQYGASVCQQLNCSHQCEIDLNKPICRCTKGYRIGVDGRTCEDIDECSIYHGGCTYFCINTPGSYYCDCTRNRYLSADGKTCKVKEGLVCKKQSCVKNQCSITSDQYCFDTVSETQQGDTTCCAAAYTYNGTTWIPDWKTCFYLRSNYSCIEENRCVLSKNLKQSYICYCKSDHCNSDDMVYFPFDQPSLTITSSSSMVTPTVTTVFSFTIQAEPDQSVSTPVFVAFVVSATGYITMLSIITTLWLWYIFRKCSSEDTNEPTNALEEEDSHRHREDQLESTRSPRLTSGITSSSNEIEMNQLPMTNDASGQDVTEHVTSL